MSLEIKPISVNQANFCTTYIFERRLMIYLKSDFAGKVFNLLSEISRKQKMKSHLLKKIINFDINVLKTNF